MSSLRGTSMFPYNRKGVGEMRPARFATAVGGALLVGGVMIPLATPAAATELPVDPSGWPVTQSGAGLPFGGPGSYDPSNLSGWSPAQSDPETVSVFPAPNGGPGAGTTTGTDAPVAATPSNTDFPSDYWSDPAVSYLYDPPAGGVPSDTGYPPSVSSDVVPVNGNDPYFADPTPSFADYFGGGTPADFVEPADPGVWPGAGDPTTGGFDPSSGGFDPSTGGFDPNTGGFDPNTDLWKLLNWLMSLSG